jgi:hypothetical protein
MKALVNVTILEAHAAEGPGEAKDFLWLTAQYGDQQVEIPLPAVWAPVEAGPTLPQQVVGGLENLVAALQSYADRMRRRQTPPPQG